MRWALKLKWGGDWHSGSWTTHFLDDGFFLPLPSSLWSWRQIDRLLVGLFFHVDFCWLSNVASWVGQDRGAGLPDLAKTKPQRERERCRQQRFCEKKMPFHFLSRFHWQSSGLPASGNPDDCHECIPTYVHKAGCLLCCRPFLFFHGNLDCFGYEKRGVGWGGVEESKKVPGRWTEKKI